MVFSVFIFSLLWASAWAANDWSKPCSEGECVHHSSSGTVKIWGDKGAIADITKGGGYSILDCHPTKLAQDIRLVCHDNEVCSSLSGKLVRLPEDCSAGAFARVGKVWDHGDQTLPRNLHSHFKRAGIPPPTVRGLSFDTDFEKLDFNNTGKIYFKVYGTNSPTANEAERKAGHLHVARATVGANHDGNLNTFSVAGAHTVPIYQSKSIDIFQKGIDCPTFKASVRAGVSATVNAKVTVGVAVEGTISPPVVSKVGIFTGIDADFNGQVQLKSSVTGGLDSGVVTIFQTGIPGLDFPGILNVGPIFKVTAQATAQLDVGLDLAVDFAYEAKQVKVIYPPNPGKKSSGNYSKKESPLKLSVSPTLAAVGTVEAHVIPTIVLGIDALGGKAKADVFVKMDSSAKVTLTMNAGGSVQVSSMAKPQGSTSGGISGCVDVGGALLVEAGATAKFFDVFDESARLNLYDMKGQIYQQCFTAGKLPANKENRPFVNLMKGGIELPPVKAAPATVAQTHAGGTFSKSAKSKRAPPTGGLKCPTFETGSLLAAVSAVMKAK